MSGASSRRISTRAYLVLRAVMIFDALLLVGVAVLLWLFMERPAGAVGAAVCFLVAGASVGGARWLDRLYRRAG